MLKFYNFFLHKATTESTPGATTTSATLSTAEPTSATTDTSSSAPAGGMPGTFGGFLQVHNQVRVLDITHRVTASLNIKIGCWSWAVLVFEAKLHNLQRSVLTQVVK